jgi:cytochrome c-type biogenesis protein CcmH
MSRTLVLLAAFALLLAAPALASEQHPTLAEMEGEIICPTCHTTLDQSDAPIAQQIKRYIAARIAAGATKSQIEASLVAQFGTGVLAEPPKKGFDLLAWLLPIGGVIAGAAVLGVLAWRWSRTGPAAPVVAAGPPLDPALERRLDEELRRFDD